MMHGVSVKPLDAKPRNFTAQSVCVMSKQWPSHDSENVGVVDYIVAMRMVKNNKRSDR